MPFNMTLQHSTLTVAPCIRIKANPFYRTNFSKSSQTENKLKNKDKYFNPTNLNIKYKKTITTTIIFNILIPFAITANVTNAKHKLKPPIEKDIFHV